MENKNIWVRCDASSLWDNKGYLPLIDYLKVRCALTRREAVLTDRLIKSVNGLMYGDKYWHIHRPEEEREYRRLLAVQLGGLGLDEYEYIYIQKRYGEDVIDFPVTEDIIEKAISGQKILVTGHNERTALIGSRKFTLDNETFFQDGPSCAVKRSIETAFLSGRTQDYAYVDAFICDGGRLKMPDYADMANWSKAYNPDRAYKANDYNSVTRFDVEHIKKGEGSRERWVLHDLLTGETQEEKTFVKCRRIAQEMSRKVSRYRNYAYRADIEAFYRGAIVRINSFYRGRFDNVLYGYCDDPDGVVIARCTDNNGNKFDIPIYELYLREEDACLPGEEETKN